MKCRPRLNIRQLSSPLKVSLLYLMFGVCWILFSDRILAVLSGSEKGFLRISLIKGQLFIGVTALLLYILLRQEARKEQSRLRQLEEHDRLLDILQQTGRIGCWEQDGITDQLVWSDIVYELFGLDPMQGPPSVESFLQAVHPEDQERVAQAFQASLKPDGKRYETVHRLIRADTGEIRWVHENCTHVRDGAGKVIRSVGTVQDVTEKMESEHQFRKLADSLPLAIIQSTGIEQKIQYCNSAFTALFGYGLEDIPTVQSWWPLAYPDPDYRKQVSEEWNSKVARAIESGRPIKPMETRVTCKDGSVRDILWRHIVLGDKNYALGLDLTEQKQAEAGIRKSEAQYRHLLTNLPDLVWLKDPDGVFLSCNPPFAALFGISECEIIGKSDYDFLDQEQADLFRTYDRKAVENRKATANEEWITFASDGHRELFETVKTPLYNPDGELTGVLGVARNITDRKKTEDELLKFKWLLEKEEGVSQVSVPPEYEEVTTLNQDGLILHSVGGAQLKNMTRSIMDLLDSCMAVYERNGDYAMGTFVSTWCGTMDNASRRLCGTDDNREALQNGKWLCHESCWAISKEAIDSGEPVDRACCGGLRIYAVPIRSDGEIIGVVNFGYGTPPAQPAVLSELAERYQLPPDELQHIRNNYRPRPPFIIGVAKHQLDAVAQLIGETVSRRRKEDELVQYREELEQRVDERTEELRTMVNAMAGREVRMAELKEEIASLKAQLEQADSEERS